MTVLNFFFSEVFFILILPILQVLGLAYALGGYPVGLKVGIVNQEVTNELNCITFLQGNSSFIDSHYDCIFNYASCHFINEIRDEDAIKIYYNSEEEALRDAKRGKLTGVVSVSSNFSEYLMVLGSGVDREDDLPEGYINIRLDQSDMQITTFLQYRLYRSFQRFNKKMLKGCGLNEKLADLPMKFNTDYGSLENNFKLSIFPPIIMQLS